MVVATPVVACLKVIFMFVDEKVHFKYMFNKKELDQ